MTNDHGCPDYLGWNSKWGVLNYAKALLSNAIYDGEEEPTTNSFSSVCKSLFILYIGITLLMTQMTSDLVSKIFLTLVSKVLFILVILYRPTLLTKRFDMLTMLTGNRSPFYAAYLSYFNTGWRRTLCFCLYSHWATEWTVWMCVCAVFSVCIYISLTFSISFIAHLSLYPRYHVHNIFTKSDSEIS